MQQHITEPTVITAVDCSVIETIEAFVRFRPGFHGDTGVRDYLYHRLMTNLPEGGRYTGTEGRGTLLAQAEWHTGLPYRKKGKSSSPGRFDIVVPKPDELNLPKPHALVAFECGRDKRALDLLRDVDAFADHVGPQPGDITKLAREICHKQLPYGYALEFFDKGRCAEAENLVKYLGARTSVAGSERLHVVVVVCVVGRRPMLRFLPASWDERIRQEFREEVTRIEGLICCGVASGSAQNSRTGASSGNRVTREDFLSSCSNPAGTLIKAIEQRLGSHVRLVFGGNTMTVNRRLNGKLLRITKALNSVSDFDPIVSHELATLLQQPIVNAGYEINDSPIFRETIIAALARTVEMT